MGEERLDCVYVMFEDKDENALLGGPRSLLPGGTTSKETQDCQKQSYFPCCKQACSMPSYMHMYPLAAVENLVKALQ